MRTLSLSLFAFLAGAPAAMAAPAAVSAVCAPPHAMRFEIAGRFQRDIQGFTEGLEVRGGALYESTGALDGGTRLLRIAPSGHVTQLADFGDRFFGEGLTFLDGQLYQLSWQDHDVFVYDGAMKLLRTMHNPHEGWGLTNDGHRLIFGDGSSHLYFADPKTFAIQGGIDVRRGQEPISNINELEYVDGKIYANIWQTREIVRLDAATGCIEAEAKMDPLWTRMTEVERRYVAMDGDFVLNGIARDPATGLFYVTGKEWPMIFTGRFVDQ